MKELALAPRYPGFHQGVHDAFQALADDLAEVHDFLSGDASALQRAAQAEAMESAERSADLMTGYVGDVRIRESMRTAFRAGRFGEVVAVARDLKFPERLSQLELRMLAIARSNAGA